MASVKNNPQKLLIIGLLVAAAVLVCTALYRPEGNSQPGWVPVNEQVERALGSQEQEQEQVKALGQGQAASVGAVVGEKKEPVEVSSADGVSASKGAGAGAEAAAKSATNSTVSAPDAALVGNATPPPSDTEGKVDINHATVEQLDTLPGIGASKAKAIAADREQNGLYHNADDLLRVKGIGPKLLAKLKSFIVLQP
ncbi:ComEA family DNA-binding protein [Paenibacillus albus]|uniref:Helix-hairpin-helix domain-containing protein n=1 Tax=Paenibacillus albus TaxID=2495582 RepID=A0A3S9A3T9_9BACL|nr:ComEA family DNA-binding protein [Paenibacillus albus]AZN40382.1 helix-hairpin-helix domain-containing protein [Paenibacillus albus]